ncbi:hypothetical protein RJ639_005124 [Escallonia herrerae]|uniref:Mitochondrial protein n=1 Tax=Escallonia herrerae TaxID=1293975 RepID=A0AA88W4Q4_9ASTE|nr:hypothetical protein RJ639_005124 [Escallonia herrerae]
MTDIGLMSYYLGIELKQREDDIFISQEVYAKEILKRYGMVYCKSIKTPMECIQTWRRRQNPSHIFQEFCWKLKVAKRILRYIKGTLDYGIMYSSSQDFKLVGYCDSDWADDKDDRKSTTGFVFFMGNSSFTWNSKKQPIVTLSTYKAEYVADTSCVCHAIWLRSLLKELHRTQDGPTKILVDNKSALGLAKNPEVEFENVKSQDQVADIFTKPLKIDVFHKLRMSLGVMNQYCHLFERYLPPFTSFLLTKGDEEWPLKPEGRKKRRGTLVENFVVSQLSYLAIFIVLICITERKKMKEDPLNFSVFNIVFEVISAYGNVGFTMGYSCSRQLKPDGSCEDKWFGFAGKWSDEGKVILILVMFLGRLKKSNMEGDCHMKARQEQDNKKLASAKTNLKAD